MVEIRKCDLSEIIDNANFQSLVKEYAEEATIAGFPPVDDKLKLYPTLQRTGMFQTIGAFLGDKLVGFVAVLTPIVPHYGVVIAVTESLFVGKVYRRTGAGLKLLRAAEMHSIDAGSPMLTVSAPSGGVLAEVLPRLGYRETNRSFVKSARA